MRACRKRSAVVQKTRVLGYLDISVANQKGIE